MKISFQEYPPPDFFFLLSFIFILITPVSQNQSFQQALEGCSNDLVPLFIGMHAIAAVLRECEFAEIFIIGSQVGFVVQIQARDAAPFADLNDCSEYFAIPQVVLEGILRPTESGSRYPAEPEGCVRRWRRWLR